MDTILVTSELPKGAGGRPQKVGSFVIAQEHAAIFMGYDQENYRKIAIRRSDLEEVLKDFGGIYKIEFNLTELQKKEKINWQKFLARFIPKKLRETIIEEGA